MYVNINYSILVSERERRVLRNKHNMNKLFNKKQLLNQLNSAVEKRERKLNNLIRERDLISKSTYSDDKEIKYEAVRKKISEIELVLERLIKQRDELEDKIDEIEYNAKIDTKVRKDKKKVSTINVHSIVNNLTNSSKNNILSYDVLYNKIPPNVLSADLIDEIVNLLKQRGIQVLDKVYKEEEVGQYLGKIDEEIIEYERNVELQLNDLYKGSFVISDNDDNISKSQTITETSTKGATALGRVDINISPPHLPRITDVIPKLTNEISSLLTSKSNTRIKEKKGISLTRIESIESTILGGAKTDSNNNDILPYQGPKIYGKTRFDNDRRLSLYAKTVGDRAEEIVIKFLEESLPQNEQSTIRWISKAGETPGWDISYYNAENQLVAIEVKGTTGDFFPNIEITANEWNAAIELQERYWIYLVTGSLGINPQIQRIQNPVRLKESGILNVTPILWKIEMMSQ